MKLIKLTLITLGFAIFFITVFTLFEPSNDPTGMFVHVPNLAVINVNNNIPLDQELDIEFITRGTNNLLIESEGDMEILSLKCGQLKVGEGSEYLDYSCEEDSFLKVEVNSPRLEVYLNFGNSVQKAVNII